MEMFKIVSTLLLFSVLVVGIVKKVQPTILLFFTGIVTLVIIGLTGGDISLGNDLSGNLAVDVSELIKTSFSNDLSGYVLNFLSVIAYIHYMDHLNATSMFTYVMTKPFKHVRSPYIALGAGILMMSFCNIFIQSATARAALFMGTIYPIFMSVGLTSLSSAGACLLGAYSLEGFISSTLNMMFWQFGDPGITLSEYCMQKEIKVIVFYSVIIAVSYCLFAKYIDKKYSTAHDISENIVINPPPDVPKWYGILPTLPLDIMLLFTIIIRDINITLPAACLLSFTIAFLSVVITSGKKNTISAINDGQEYFVGLGEALKGVGAMVLCASIFAVALQKIGGIDILVDFASSKFSDTSKMSLFIGIGISLLYGITIILSGNMGSFATLFITLACSIAVGESLQQIQGIIVLGAPLFDALSPIATGAIIVSETSKNPVNELIRRCFVPVILGYISVIIGVLLFY